MPWVRAMLRGQTVFARAATSGELVLEGGRVEVRYKANDGRFYRALARNLDVLPGPPLPDETCGTAEAAGAGAEGAQPKAPRSPRAAAAPAPAEPAEDASGALVFYTDGACTGNPGPAGLGVYMPGSRPTELSEYLGHATNNVAELTAILRALEMLPTTSGGRATIHTDSQYAIGVLQKGWRAKANRELVADIKARLAAHPRVRLSYVPGHAGISGNERADQLAREAVRSGKTWRSTPS